MTTKKATKRRAAKRSSSNGLDAMIAEATADAHDESEQVMGWFDMIEERLELPFDTEVLGVSVRVIRIDHSDDDRLVAICVRGRIEQAIGLVDLPFPDSPPEGFEWVEAYCDWREQG